MTATTTSRHGRKLWIRRFNKKVTNRILGALAGRYIYANVHHVGRRSGKLYTTPVVAMPIASGFIMPLPYGDDTDWCRNVLAAGGCTITWNRATYAVDSPEVLDAAQAAPMLPRVRRVLYRLFGIGLFLRVRRRDERAPSGA